MVGLERELNRGSTDLLILALLEERDRHGYELARLIDERSRGAISFHAASLYPTLHRMEARGLIGGRWVEKAGQRRRRYYKVTRAGRKTLASQRTVWGSFFDALNRLARIREACRDRPDPALATQSLTGAREFLCCAAPAYRDDRPGCRGSRGPLYRSWDISRG